MFTSAFIRFSERFVFAEDTFSPAADNDDGLRKKQKKKK